jgi:hypothetical protein
MKNFQLLIIILISIVAGYFAYPYFNDKKEDHLSVVEQSRSESRSSDGDVENKGFEHKTVDRVDVNQIPNETSQAKSVEVADTEGISKSGIDKSIIEEGVKKEHNETSSFSQTSFSSIPTTSTGDFSKKDFSYYKLGKSSSPIGISTNDPRLVLIAGSYQGQSDSTSIELEINGKGSSIRTFKNGDFDEAHSFNSEDGNFFVNERTNGNVILIENGKNKLSLDISRWPVLILTTEEKNPFILYKK